MGFVIQKEADVFSYDAMKDEKDKTKWLSLRTIMGVIDLLALLAVIIIFLYCSSDCLDHFIFCRQYFVFWIKKILSKSWTKHPNLKTYTDNKRDDKIKNKNEGKKQSRNKKKRKRFIGIRFNNFT